MFGSSDDDQPHRLAFSRRAMLIGGLQFATFGVIAARLHKLQVVDGPNYVPLADDNRVNVQILGPQRGRILDRFGEVLASNRESYRAIVIPGLAGDLRAVATRFASVVPVSEADLARLLARAKRQQPNLPIVLAGELTFEQIARINLLAPQLPGVRTEIDSRRRYFHGPTVGHVVGYVGGVERVALDDDPVLRLPGMRTGKSGVELGMEDVLRGVGGHVKQEVDVRGRVVRMLEERQPERGRDIVVTIDTQLQANVLARMSREKQAALVAMDVTSGDIVAMASVPQYDTSIFAQPGAGKELRRLQTTQHNPMVNRAIRGSYPPGSTFKMVVALAALEAGVVSLRERIPCDGRFVYADHTYRCWKRHGHDSADLHKALRESCDVYFYELARRTGIDAIARMARKLGLGQIYDCGIAPQKPGLIPDPAWKQTRLGKPWLGGETILAGVGQGYVQTTPLQLAVMTARIASGLAVEPRLVRPAAGEILPPPLPMGVRPEWMDAVRRAMFGVINEDGGTGSSARLEEGTTRLSGKTGTSQVTRLSSERGHSELQWHERDHALFVAYAPSARPRYAIAAVIEHAGSGGQAAGPLVRDVMTELLRSDPSSRPVHTLGPGVSPSGSG